MSSLRNAIQRRNHRERAQPTERTKWGLLEKPKDYKLRAADHKAKQRKITALKQKASARNEDEFYFGMVNTSSVGGIRRAKRGEENAGGGGKSLGVDVVKLMKTQDRGYLQTMLQRRKRERERIEREVVAVEVGVRVQPLNGKKTVFGDDEEPAALRPVPHGRADDDLDLDDLREDPDEDEGGQSEAEERDLSLEEQALRRLKQHALEAKRRNLAALKEQERKLATALEEVDHQRAKMNGKIGGVNKNGIKYKVRQRKR